MAVVHKLLPWGDQPPGRLIYRRWWIWWIWSPQGLKTLYSTQLLHERGHAWLSFQLYQNEDCRKTLQTWKPKLCKTACKTYTVESGEQGLTVGEVLTWFLRWPLVALPFHQIKPKPVLEQFFNFILLKMVGQMIIAFLLLYHWYLICHRQGCVCEVVSPSTRRWRGSEYGWCLQGGGRQLSFSRDHGTVESWARPSAQIRRASIRFKHGGKSVDVVQWTLPSSLGHFDSINSGGGWHYYIATGFAHDTSLIHTALV